MRSRRVSWFPAFENHESRGSPSCGRFIVRKAKLGQPPNTGRMNQFQFSVGATPKTLTGAVGWNSNWTMGSLAITDQLNTANTQNCTYAYDNLARINSVNCVNGSNTLWTQNFTLDPFGNLSKSGTSSFAATYLLSNGTTNNREQSVGSCAPTYDANGNLTKDCSFTTPYTYTWNADGNPATLNGVGLTYDALGREAETASGSNYTQVLYSPIGKLGLMNGRTANTVRVPLPGGSTAELLVGGDVRTLHADWLGSSRLSTGYYNRILAYDAAYAPYGENYAGTGASGDLNFTGQSQDTLSGMYDFLYREYNPVQGRWISPDPSGLGAVDPTTPQSWNRYAYVLNNPLSNVDPSGLDCVTVDGDGNVTGTEGGDCPDVDPNNEYYINCDDCLDDVTFVGQTGYDSQGDPVAYFDSNYNYLLTNVTGSWLCGGACPGYNDAGVPAAAANNGSWWSGLVHSPWVVSWILPLTPVPGIAGVGPAGSIAWNPATKTLCGSIGAGASVGDNLAAGPVTGRTLNGQPASPSQVNQVFSGWSVNGGVNVPIGPVPVGPGVQGSANGSGVVYGPTVGVAGASVSSTYAVCASF